MRLALWASLLVGCGASPPASPTALGLHAEFAAPSRAAPPLSVATAAIHLVDVVAVSDRSSSDGRARVATLDLPMAGATDVELSGVAPALYSGLAFALGDADTPGIDVAGALGTSHLHATLSSGAVYVSCTTPIALAPAARVHLSLRVDPSGWFDGLDLASASADTDDNGIIISSDDNAGLAERLLASALATFVLDCR
jgi:hypothetical protein